MPWNIFNAIHSPAITPMSPNLPMTPPPKKTDLRSGISNSEPTTPLTLGRLESEDSLLMLDQFADTDKGFVFDALQELDDNLNAINRNKSNSTVNSLSVKPPRKQTLGVDDYEFSLDDIRLSANAKSAPVPYMKNKRPMDSVGHPRMASAMSYTSNSAEDDYDDSLFEKKITVRKFRSIMSRSMKSYDIDGIVDDLRSDDHPDMIDLKSIPKYTKRVQTLDAKHWKETLDSGSD